VSLKLTFDRPKAKEAALFIVKQGVEEVGWYDKIVNPDVLRGYLDLVRVALQDGK